MSERANVLVIDDDPTSAERLKEAVERFHHRARVALTWTEAVRVFSSEHIDIVLMDAVMPTVDGYKLTKIFRNRSKSYVPIVFTTALNDLNSRERCVTAGADDVLTKPVDPSELNLRLTAMLRIRKLTLELEARRGEMETIAMRDQLTGLLNRRAFDDNLRNEIARARRYGRPLGLMVVDIDLFKRVNDTQGHDRGDELLSQLGHLMLSQVRAPDMAFRYGGEEFVILTPETESKLAINLAERIRLGFKTRSSSLPTGTQTLSIGIADTSMLDRSREITGRRLFKLADAALYGAKRGGRNRVEVATSALEAELSEDSAASPSVD